MEVSLSLALPRDGLSVPVARRLLRQSLDALGVQDSVTSDIEIALTEACTNVLDHAADGDEYEVRAAIHGTECVIEVVDTGQGFDDERHGFGDAASGAESGRGIQLMRALVDRVSFNHRGDGTVVYLEKRLSWVEGAPLERLAGVARPSGAER